jgi:hypothetical protein
MRSSCIYARYLLDCSADAVKESFEAMANVDRTERAAWQPRPPPVTV